MAIDQFFSYGKNKKKYISMKWWCWYPFCISQTRWVRSYDASSLKQQSGGKHVAPFRHIILIPSEPVLLLIYIDVCLFRITTPLHRGYIQAGVPAVRLKYNYVHITI